MKIQTKNQIFSPTGAYVSLVTLMQYVQLFMVNFVPILYNSKQLKKKNLKVIHKAKNNFLQKSSGPRHKKTVFGGLQTT